MKAGKEHVTYPTPALAMPTQLNDKTLSLAVAQTLQMWIHEKYCPFLLCAEPGQLTAEWFRWFLGQWNVARTIRKNSQESVCRYLNAEFRNLLREGNEEAVDVAALYIQQQGWSSQNRVNGQHTLPISLVSKIGFFLCPSQFVPKDGYALKGLNRMLCRHGKVTLNNPTYRDYLRAFDHEYVAAKAQLRAAMKDDWVVAFAHKLGCPANALMTPALLRKVFDNYLMRTGGYQPSW